jgi:hypothetical protein
MMSATTADPQNHQIKRQSRAKKSMTFPKADEDDLLNVSVDRYAFIVDRKAT